MRQRGEQPDSAALAEPWTPDRLAAIDEPRPARWSDLIGEIVLVACLVAALFAQRPGARKGSCHQTQSSCE
ncbi:hypothetical protein [Nonomuraea sp. NPDC052265]|uniref:hypothetical protein n=1 Tax=Nonomuraea sp. NPDC052265 TaxID=3364374 RepID=UPI0037CA119A